MGNLKQRLIKAGRDYNYAEGVKVKATSAVYADQIVYVTASDGPYLSVATADADGGATANGRLMVAKHDIPASGYGVVLPWKLVTGFNTLAGAVGDPVFLADAPGSAAASNLTLTAPSGDAKVIVVGRVTVDATAGAVLVHADAPESRVQGGLLVTGATEAEPRPMETLAWVLSGATTTVTLDYPVTILKVGSYKVGTTAGTLNVYNGAGTSKPVCSAITMGTAANTEVSAIGFSTADATVAAGTSIRAVKTGSGGDATDRVVIHVIRA
jgi:hypothetical protein